MPDVVYIALGLLLLAGVEGGAWVRRRMAHAPHSCLYCSYPLRWNWRLGGAQICRICALQERAARRAGLDRVHSAALQRAWDACLRGPKLWQHVGQALAYSGAVQPIHRPAGESVDPVLARIARR